MNYTNIAAYKFVALSSDLVMDLQKQLKKITQEQQIKGTILLSDEGINLFLAGTASAIQVFTEYLCGILPFSDMQFKISQSDFIPFKRMNVRIKKEIIRMNIPEINPSEFTAPYIEPKQLQEWLSENKDTVLLDTRNGFEFDKGTFTNAIRLDMESFSDFPEAIKSLPANVKDQPIVTFCTGGIRCEKAAAYLLKQGYTKVWQLKGGILDYFAQCGGQYFQGNCFVFDDRIALDNQLNTVERLN